MRSKPAESPMNFPRPMAVELLPHDPALSRHGRAGRRGLFVGSRTCRRDVHHIGSTAIPSMSAKPILDSCLFPRLQRQQVGADQTRRGGSTRALPPLKVKGPYLIRPRASRAGWSGPHSAPHRPARLRCG
ncbi:MAG: GrpB family protein [Hyphomicrobium sp.]|nr:GrpB family protein [Hyphomicrobium sp.]